LGAETQRQALRCFGRLAAVTTVATIGVALTGAFCQGYLWKAQDPSRGAKHLFWEPESLVAITVLEFAVLGAFIIRAATRAHAIGALGWAIFVLFIFNIVLTVALFGVPVY
jgi:hypothetical protein